MKLKLKLEQLEGRETPSDGLVDPYPEPLDPVPIPPPAQPPTTEPPAGPVNDPVPVPIPPGP